MKMCNKGKRILKLNQKYDNFVKHGRLDLAQKVRDTIKSLKMEGIKEKPLFQPKIHEEEELVVKTYNRFCDQCEGKFISPYKTRKQKCLYCKLKNKSVAEAKKLFELLLDSDLFLEKKEIKK
jgi:hypothetical protein